MAALWWAGCPYGGFKVLQWCSRFPRASIFDVQHVAGNSSGAPGALFFSRHSCHKAWWHDVCWNSLIYIFTHEVCVCVFVCVCAQMSASLCNTIVRCHLQSAAVLAAPPPAHKSQQIKTLHSIKSSEKPVYWWSGVKTTGGWTGRWREREGERERWGVRVAEAARQPGSGRLQGLLLSAIVEGARWDNWSPKLNAQHAFLMSPHCCSFNI